MFYADVKDLIEGVELELMSMECKCADEMRKARVKRASWSLDVPYYPAWICPAHGYKRL